MTKIDKKIIAIAILFGLFVGIFDAILDTLFFYEAPFWDLLLFDIPNHELYIRSLIFVMFFIFGIISSLILNQLKIEKQEVINSRRSLQTISQINQAVMHATEEKELLKDICQIIIDSGYKLAWVGYLSQEDRKSVV